MKDKQNRTPSAGAGHASAYAALLRGINVGGKNMLPMKELAAMFTEAGCEAISTYIQSGNVVFRAAPAVAKSLPEAISGKIEARFGFRIPVVMRSAAEINAILNVRPVGLDELPGNLSHVYFLATEPSAAAVAALDPNRSPPDTFRVQGREIYAQFPNGAGNSKLTNAWFDGRLKTVSTARNWNTVLKLAEMMKAIAST